MQAHVAALLTDSCAHYQETCGKTCFSSCLAVTAALSSVCDAVADAFGAQEHTGL